MKSNPNNNLSKKSTYAALTLNPGKRSEDKVLGVSWDTESDEPIINLRASDETQAADEKITLKWELLQGIASVYNSLGILLPIVVTLKLCFRSCLKKGPVGMTQ